MDQQKNKQPQDDQDARPQQTTHQNTAPDPRQQAIEQEDDTARLRSERQSVQDGEGNSETQGS